MHHKHILFIFGQAPYPLATTQHALIQAGIDNLFAHASLNCNCRVLFLGDGIEQLNPHLSVPEEKKSCAKQFNALPLYDVDAIHCLTSPPNDYALSEHITEINPHQMRQLIQTSDIIYRY